MAHEDAEGRPQAPAVKPSTQDEARRALSTREVLALRDFRLLWLGQLISNVGDGLTTFALVIIIHRLTGSTAAVATMSIVLAVPQIVVGLLAGVFVDRWDNRRTMIGADLVRAVLVVGFVFVRDASDLWIAYALGFAQATVGTFFTPARSALMPRIVPREGLVTANTMVQTTKFVARVGGEALAGVLLALKGGELVVFSSDALTFVVSALLLVRVGVRASAAGEDAPGRSKSTMGQLVEGLRIIGRDPAVLSSTAVITTITLGIGAVLVLSVPYLVEVQQVRTELLGVMGIAEIVGMIVGTGLITAFASRVDPKRVIVVGVCIVGVMLAAIGGAPSIGWVLAETFCIGVVAAPIDACVDTLVQIRTPGDARGRVSSAMNTVFTLASLVSMVLAGALGDRIGLRNVFYAAGALTLASGVLAAPFMLSAGPLDETRGG